MILILGTNCTLVRNHDQVAGEFSDVCDLTTGSG